jgi:hypothetical protein
VDCFQKPSLEKTLCSGSSSSMVVEVGGEAWWGMTQGSLGSALPYGTWTLARNVPAARWNSRLTPASNHLTIAHYHRQTSVMPPRKKAKASAASTPHGDTQPKTPQDSGPVQSQDDVPNDPWADEQETQLFKSMMMWKPTGQFWYLSHTIHSINNVQACTSISA